MATAAVKSVPKKAPAKRRTLIANVTNKLPSFKYGFGWVMRDEISKFEGAIVYRMDNITGCNQYGLQPVKKKHGTELKHLDEGRLTFTGEVVQLPITDAEVQAAPGGMKPSIPQFRK